MEGRRMNVQHFPEETRDPGYAEYACRTAVRDLIAAIGEEAARDRIRSYLDDETGRVKTERMVA
jgi:hypothetical protein